MNCRPTCPVCGGGFDGETRLPLVLPSCGHTICRACLGRLTQHKGYSCPTCRVKQPQKMVSELHRNHILLELILKHKEDGEDKQMTQCNVEPKDNQETCKTHKGVRLMYWCLLSNRPACGECIFEKYPIYLEKAKKITDFLEEKNREAHCSVEELIMIIEEFKTTYKEHNSFINKINALSKTSKKVARKLLLSAAVIESQVTYLKSMNEHINEMEKMTSKIFSEAPSCPTGIKGIQVMQEYINKVHKLQVQVMGNIQMPIKDLGVAAEFLDDAMNLTETLNTKASDLIEKVCQNMMKEMVVEAAMQKSAKLKWEDNKFHLYCLRENSNNCTTKSNLKWNWFQRLLKEEETTVFLDMLWGKGQKSHNKYQGRVYIQLQSGQLSGQHLLELCTGESTSFLDNSLISKERVAGGEGILLGIHHHHQQEEMTDTSNKPTQPCIYSFQLGDVLSEYCEKAKETRFWLLTEDCDTETYPNSSFTFTGSLSFGKELLTKAVSQRNLEHINITNCGVIIQA